jgi:formamidopyrimidine-DNA glycosylase
MPELPDIELYLHALRQHVEGKVLERFRLVSPVLLRTYEPPITVLEDKAVTGFHRIGKRIVFEFEDDLFAVLHLMVSGRLQWRKPGTAIPRKRAHGAMDFPDGSLLITEASTKKRASLYILEGREGLAEHDRGGVEPLEITKDEFTSALRSQNRTMKRVLTDQHIFSGIGNAYSDEILHNAKLSPVQRSRNLSDAEVGKLFTSVREVLTKFRDRLISEHADGWPTKVTAFRKDMAVHGKYGEPCPVCGSPVQRIQYASNETNYCATCQTGGKLLADRSLSRLLKDDWPKTLEELEHES